MNLVSYGPVVSDNYADAAEESRNNRRRPPKIINNKPDYVSDTLRAKIDKALPSRSSARFSTYYKIINDLHKNEYIDYESPKATALAQARSVLQQFEIENMEPTQVVASVEGGVAICFVSGNKYSDIECLNGGEMLGVISNRKDRPTVWQIDPSTVGIAQAVARIRDYLGREAKPNDEERAPRRSTI